MEGLTQLVFRLSLVPGIGRSSLRRILRSLRSPSDTDMLQMLLSVEQKKLLDGNYDSSEELLSTLREENVDILAWNDLRYPKRLIQLLGDAAPLLLYARGQIELFETASIGFCGSRKASIAGINFTKHCAAALVEVGVTVISGNASGVDRVAHGAALEAGGSTIAVLPEGILRAQLSDELRALFDDSRVLVTSEFPPLMPWSIGNAMQRNQTICALSRAVVVVEAGETGGTVAAAKRALGLGVPVYVACYDGLPASAVGNWELISEGAKKLCADDTEITTIAENINYTSAQGSLF